MPKKGGGAPSWAAPLRWASWALAFAALGSAFAPLTPGLQRGVNVALCLFSLLEAGIAIGHGRRLAFFLYAAIAVLANPLRPFTFAPQIWRMVHAGAGIWFAADHLPRS
jgi:hypothetical protein